MNTKQQKLLALAAELGVDADEFRELHEKNSRRAYCLIDGSDFVECHDPTRRGISILVTTSGTRRTVKLARHDAERFANTILAEIRKAR